MNTEIDWRSELEAAVGTRPDRPVESFALAGRRALRRRRAAVAVSGVATVAAVAGLAWVVTPGDGVVRPDAPVATQGTPSPTAEQSAAPPTASPAVAPLATRPEDVRAAESAQSELFDGPSMPVTALGNGELVRHADWEVEAIYVLDEQGTRRRVWGVSAVPSSGGKAVWMLITWRPAGVGAVSDPEGKRFAVFEDWLDQTWAERQGIDEPRTAWTEEGRLVVAPGVDVLATVDRPRQAAAYGPVAEQVAARLRVGDGTVVFVLAGPDGATTVDPAVLPEPTMDAFLSHLEQQSASGEGLR